MSNPTNAIRPLLLAFVAMAGVAVLYTAYEAMGHPNHPLVMESSLDEDAIPDNAVRPRPGAKIKLAKRDKPEERISGRVVWFTIDKVGYLDQDEVQLEADWSDLDPKRLGPFLSGLPDRRDADSLLMVAEIMIDQQVELERIEHMFRYALRADDQVAERVEALREKLNQGPTRPGPGDEDGPGDPADGEAGNDEPKRGADGQPQIDNPRAWPEMTEEQHTAAVNKLDEATQAVLQKMNHNMGSTQTERFLVFSDMPAKESRYWVSLLDKMYDRLCGVFDLDKEKNIWKGKCLLLFFNSEADYLRYNQAAYNNDATGSAGICYQFGNGDVHVAMYKQNNEKDLAHVLVHEAVHGFLFRYMSSHYVPNWLNEGLAEYIAVALVDSGEYPGRATSSRRFVKTRGGLDNFLTARNIIGQHYGLAYDVTEMMVKENKKGYVKMIQGIKEGLSTEEAFDQNYGASVDRVFQYYAKSRLDMDGIDVK